MIVLPGPKYEELIFRSDKIDELVESVTQSLNTSPDVVGPIFNALPSGESVLLDILGGNGKLYYILRERGSEMISQDFVHDLDKIVGNIDRLLVGRKKQIFQRLSPELSGSSKSRHVRLAT